jgi:hypothetical protein
MNESSKRGKHWKPGVFYNYRVHDPRYGANILHDRSYVSFLDAYPEKTFYVDYREEEGGCVLEPVLADAFPGTEIHKELQLAALTHDVNVFQVGSFPAGLVPWTGEPRRISQIQISNRMAA